MNAMNILIVTAYPPVLNMHGGGVRMYHNIRILAAKHRVHVLSFVENDTERKSLESLRTVCESIEAIDRIPDLAARPWSLEPEMMRYFNVADMHRAVSDSIAVNDIDVLQCEYLQMTQFHRPDVLTIFTAHEVMSANSHEEFQSRSRPLEKIRSYYGWMAMLRYEVRAVRRFDRVVTMTGADRDYLGSYAPDADVRDIPIGVDAGWYSPKDVDSAKPLEAVFLGNFRHTPNIEAVHFLREHLMPHFPRLLFQIAGSNVPDGLVEGTDARLLGYQPDTRVLYNRPNTMVVAPLFSGTGQRVKLLEAFSMAMPVITTSVGAMGFPVRDGVEAFVADTPETYRRALRKLCSSAELRLEMGGRAREMILEEFDWDRLGGRFFDVISPMG